MSNLDFQISQLQQHLQNPVYQETQQQNLDIQQSLYQQHITQLLHNNNNQGHEEAALNSSQAVVHGRQAKPRQRSGIKGTVGEIVQVQGGHIVRSIGRKDRHSKVCTAKGPRDRRVRLAAHTAIEFYDVQDRLGYDRPSKAVDWLIKKAKSAIDKLAELPPYQPSANDANATIDVDQNMEPSEKITTGEQSQSSGYSFQLHRNNDRSFTAPPVGPDTVPDDTMKSLFPTSSTNSSMNFQSYNPSDIISRATSHTEDLGLSLHCFQYQGIIPGQSQAGASHTPSNEIACSAQVEYEEANLMGWNNNTSRASGGLSFNPLSMRPQQEMLNQVSAFSQRGSLQSNFSQSLRAWNDLSMASADHHRAQENHQPFIFGSRFAPEGFTGYSIPARIQWEEEQRLVSDRPCSSSSPNSQH